MLQLPRRPSIHCAGSVRRTKGIGKSARRSEAKIWPFDRLSGSTLAIADNSALKIPVDNSLPDRRVMIARTTIDYIAIPNAATPKVRMTSKAISVRVYSMAIILRAKRYTYAPAPFTNQPVRRQNDSHFKPGGETLAKRAVAQAHLGPTPRRFP
jgi:hypothetical protein